MKCEEFKDILSDSLDHRVIEGNPEAMGHIKTCEGCKRQYFFARKIGDGFADIAKRPAPPELAEKILKIPQKFSSVKDPTSFWKRFDFQLTLSLAFAALFFFVISFQETFRSSQIANPPSSISPDTEIKAEWQAAQAPKFSPEIIPNRQTTAIKEERPIPKNDKKVETVRAITETEKTRENQEIPGAGKAGDTSENSGNIPRPASESDRFEIAAAPAPTMEEAARRHHDEAFKANLSIDSEDFSRKRTFKEDSVKSIVEDGQIMMMKGNEEQPPASSLTEYAFADRLPAQDASIRGKPQETVRNGMVENSANRPGSNLPLGPSFPNAGVNEAETKAKNPLSAKLEKDNATVKKASGLVASPKPNQDFRRERIERLLAVYPSIQKEGAANLASWVTAGVITKAESETMAPDPDTRWEIIRRNGRWTALLKPLTK